MNYGMDRIAPLDSCLRRKFTRPVHRLIEAWEKQHRSFHERRIQRDMFAEYEAIAAWGTVTCCYSGIEIDSTTLSVCHNKRIGRHRVFAEVARRGKSSMGWFYGFKLHLIVNDQGELLAVQRTPGNTDDRKPVPQMTKKLWGKLVGDRAISPKRSLKNCSHGDCN